MTDANDLIFEILLIVNIKVSIEKADDLALVSTGRPTRPPGRKQEADLENRAVGTSRLTRISPGGIPRLGVGHL